MAKPRGVYFENFGENYPSHNDTLLYHDLQIGKFW